MILSPDGGFNPQLPGSEVVTGLGSVVGPEDAVEEDAVLEEEVEVVVSPPVYSPGQNPLHSPHRSTERSPPLLTAQLDFPSWSMHSW